MSPVRKRTYTLEQANRILPRVAGIVARLVEAHGQWRELRLATELQAARDTADDPDPLARTAERELIRLAERVTECVADLEALGLSFRGFDRGLVDFPSHIGGRPAYLCWRLGEPAVEYWHEVDAGFAGRQRIAPRALV